MMKTTWEKSAGSTQHYCHLTSQEVQVGSHSGSPHSDVASSCTHAEFLAGTHQHTVLRCLGEEALLEILTAIGGSSADQRAHLLPTRSISPSVLVIPEDVTSRRRQEWEKYGATVLGNFQPIPHFDALAPTLDGMSRCTPLTRALQTVSEYELIKFIDQYDPHELDGNGASPLNMAILHPVGDQLMNLLIDRGSDVNAPDGNGVYPLEVAIATQQAHKFIPLKRAKVDISQRFNDDRTYLHLAVERRCSLSMSPLKKLKVDLNAVDRQGQTALHYSVFNGYTDPLVKLKVDPSVKNHEGESALEVALRGALAHRTPYLCVEGSYKDKDAIYLIENGVMTMRVNGGKPRALKFDVERSLARKFCPDHVTFLRFLEVSVSLCKVADLEHLTAEGVSVLQLIADLQRPDFAKVLKKRGVALPTPRAATPIYERPLPPTHMR